MVGWLSGGSVTDCVVRRRLSPCVRDCKRQQKRSLNVLCVRSILWDEMTTNSFPGGGVCALEKKKKKKKRRENLEGGSGRSGPEWVVGGYPLSCVRGMSGVWCSYGTCNVSSSLFYWLPQSSFVTRCISCVFTTITH